MLSEKYGVEKSPTFPFIKGKIKSRIDGINYLSNILNAMSKYDDVKIDYMLKKVYFKIGFFLMDFMRFQIKLEATWFNCAIDIKNTRI